MSIFETLTAEQQEAFDTYMKKLAALYATPPWASSHEEVFAAEQAAFWELESTGALERYAQADEEAQG